MELSKSEVEHLKNIGEFFKPPRVIAFEPNQFRDERKFIDVKPSEGWAYVGLAKIQQWIIIALLSLILPSLWAK